LNAQQRPRLGAGSLEAQAAVAGARKPYLVLRAKAELALGAARVERESVAEVRSVEITAKRFS
jgi:hypothetical protein